MIDFNKIRAEFPYPKKIIQDTSYLPEGFENENPRFQSPIRYDLPVRCDSPKTFSPKNSARQLLDDDFLNKSSLSCN